MKNTTQLIAEAVERFRKKFLKQTNYPEIRLWKKLQSSTEQVNELESFWESELQSLEKTVRERLAKEVEEMDQNLIGTMDSIAGYEKALKDVLAKLDTKV